MAVIGLAAPSLAMAAEWRPDFSLQPRPDGPGLASLSKPPPPQAYLADGPADAADREAWRAGMLQWRTVRRPQIAYHDGLYRLPGLAWTRHVFNQDQLLVWDRSLYDPVRHEYTVDKALAGIEKRFGPLDSILIWPGYPNIGLDDRNQFDLMRDFPGGIPGLRRMIQAFHRRGVRVFFPVVVWDRATHDDGIPATAEMSRLMHDIGADGINFDTLDKIPDDAGDPAATTAAPLALEPQFDPQNPSLAGSAISWDDWVLWDDLPWPFVPRVSQVKWLEPRHAVEVTDRYARNKVNSLQHAFFNGQGYVVIENMWGFWSGFSARDAETVRRFTRIERAYADLLVSPDWEPHAATQQTGIFASRFPGTGQTLWTLVNRNEYDVDGDQIAVPMQPGMRFYDLWHGRELVPVVRDGKAILDFPIESLGFGVILAETGRPRSHMLSDLLTATAKDAAQPLGSYSTDTPSASQTMVPTASTAPAAVAPAGMVAIPSADYDFRVNGIEIENGNDPGVDVQFPWESSPRRHHRHVVHVDRFFIDRAPVTNAAFKRFLAASHYHPADDHGFLLDWRNGNFPEGWDNKPVTWVSIEDARAYALWAGKRLPHVWEWQYAAQGTDGRSYPWGGIWDPHAVPAQDHAHRQRPPTDVAAFPAGASPFGVLDLEGNVAQWTDEFRDAHTRAAILRGGDFYRPGGTMWYFPKSYRLDEQEKYLLMAPGRDRSGLVGFRCVRDG